jgi:hypothetical protein
MSRLLQAFMWTKPGFFLFGNVIVWLAVSTITAILFNRKEGYE